MRPRLLAVGLLAVGMTALGGCGSSYVSVTGVVTLDGEPLPEANVSFLPENPKDEPAGGVTDENGRFVLYSDQERGAKPGKYKVLIEAVAERPAPQGSIGMAMSAKYSKGGGSEQKTDAKAAAALNSKMNKEAAAAAKRQRRNSPAVYADANKTPLTATVPQSEYKFELHKDAK